MHRLRLKLQATMKQFTIALFALTCLLTFSTITHAHEAQPAVATFTIGNDDLVTIDLLVDLEAMIAGIGPQHADGDFKKAAHHLKLRKMSPDELTQALNDFTGELLSNIKVKADDTLLITSLEGSKIPESTNPLLIRESVVSLKTKLPKGAKTLTWQWNKDYGVIALRLNSPSKNDIFNAYLEAGALSETFDLSKFKEQSE